MVILVLILVLALLVVGVFCRRERKLRKEYESEYYTLRGELWHLQRENASLQSRLSRKGIKMHKREKK